MHSGHNRYTPSYGKKSAAAPHCGFFSPQSADFFQMIASSLLAQLQLHSPKTVILYIITCQLTIHGINSLATTESISTINYNEISHSDSFLWKKIRSGPHCGFFPILLCQMGTADFFHHSLLSEARPTGSLALTVDFFPQKTI